MNVSLTPEPENPVLEALRAEIRKGLDDVAQGRVRDGREVMAELKAKYVQQEAS